MLVIDAAIELIIPDNTAFTVLTALRQLGYEDLTRVERSEHVLLSVSREAEPEHVVAQLARAEVVFNPNKHRMSYATQDERPVTPPQFEAIVQDKDENNDHLVALLSGTFGMSALRGLKRAVGWRLYDRSGPATRDRLQWACSSLLANPISQTYEIRPRPVRHQVREIEEAAAKAKR